MTDAVSPTVIVVMGVAGAGKSTLGRALADRLGAPFLEADDLHLTASVDKMRRGEPLADADRWPWLEAVAGWIDGRVQESVTAVVACSALKRSYRALLARDRPQVRFVHIAASPELVAERMDRRRGHYFPASLIASQFEALEPPEKDEDAVIVDGAAAVRAQMETAIAGLKI